MRRVSSFKFNHVKRGTSWKTGAFTLVELLVVIAIIGILAALLLSALSAAKDRAVRIRCLSNIKQYSLASMSYAHDNNDRFPRVGDPSISVAGYGGWESHSLLNVTLCDIFTRYYGLTPSIFYDPGIPKSGRPTRLVAPGYENVVAWRYVNEDLYSETNVGGMGAVTKSRFIGYTHTFGALSGPPSPTYAVDPANWNLTSIPQPINVGSVLLPAPKSSERALIAGLIPGMFSWNQPFTKPYFSQYEVLIPTDLRTNFEFVLVRPAHSAGKNNSPGVPMPEPWNGFYGAMMPRGDNVGFLDGSARWRKFKDMTRHNSSNLPYTMFW